MVNKISLPVIDYFDFSQEVADHFDDLLNSMTQSSLASRPPAHKIYSMIARQMTGYDIKVNEQLSHYVFTSDEEALMFKMRFKQ